MGYDDLFPKVFNCTEKANGGYFTSSTGLGGRLYWAYTNTPMLQTYGYNAHGTVAPLLAEAPAAPDTATALGLANQAAEAAVINPSQMIAIACQMDSAGVYRVLATPAGNFYWPSRRHANGANVLYCDGHVEHSKRSALLDFTDEARRQWNRDN